MAFRLSQPLQAAPRNGLRLPTSRFSLTELTERGQIHQDNVRKNDAQQIESDFQAGEGQHKEVREVSP